MTLFNLHRKAPSPQKEFFFHRYRPIRDAEDGPRITILEDASWSYCGPLIQGSAGLPPSFKDFASATFSGPILSQLLPFLDSMNGFLIAHNLSHYLLTIRGTVPTNEFDQSRWHTDDLFFAFLADGELPGTRLGLRSRYDNRDFGSPETFSGTDWKICTSLFGPPTLFIPLQHQAAAREEQRQAQKKASTDHDCVSIRCVGCASAAEAVRRHLAVNLARFGVETAGPGECAVFRVGRDTGAVHSEPSMSDSLAGRVFVNVVPGTEAELKSLMGKWGMEFPRNWWISKHLRSMEKEA